MSATPNHTASTRPLVLLNEAIKVSLAVPSSQPIWTAAQIATDSFHDALKLGLASGEMIGFDVIELDEDDPDQAKKDDEREKELVLTVHFLLHLAQLLEFPSETSAATASVLLATFTYFSTTYLIKDGVEVHTLAATFPAPIRSLILSAYFSARSKLHVAGSSSHLPPVIIGGLLEAAREGKAEVYALFGGQGMNEVYFDELQVRPPPFLYLSFLFTCCGTREL